MSKKRVSWQAIESDLKAILKLDVVRLLSTYGSPPLRDLLKSNDHFDLLHYVEYDCELSELDDIDIAQFEITDTMRAAYNTVYDRKDGVWFTEPEAAHLSLFLEFLPRSDGRGGVPSWLTDEGSCIRIAHTALALRKVEASIEGTYVTQAGLYDYFLPLTVRDVATLANMSEGSVRNAIASRKADRLEKMVQPGGSVLIDTVEACRWLAERRGYKARPGRPHGGGYFPGYARSNPENALRWLAMCMYWHSGSVVRTAEQLGCGEADISNLLSGQFPHDEADLRAFAKIACVEPDDLVAGARILQSGTGG